MDVHAVMRLDIRLLMLWSKLSKPSRLVLIWTKQVHCLRFTPCWSVWFFLNHQPVDHHNPSQSIIPFHDIIISTFHPTFLSPRPPRRSVEPPHHALHAAVAAASWCHRRLKTNKKWWISWGWNSWWICPRKQRIPKYPEIKTSIFLWIFMGFNGFFSVGFFHAGFMGN